MDIVKDLNLPGEIPQDFTAFDKLVTKQVTEKYNQLKEAKQ